MAVRAGAATDRGRMREGNEDNYASTRHLFAVADGLGGHQGGEVASKIAVDTLAALDEGGPWSDERSALDALRQSIRAANLKIRELAARDRTLQGMGTTLTAVLEDGLTFHLAHIGDSRAYLYRGGHLTRLTEDHSLVQQFVNEGRLTPEEAEHHPQASIITRALGMDVEVEPDVATYRRESGDRLLLCTDGLSRVVDETTIRRVLARIRDPQEAADDLVARANAEGGPDNITVVILDTEGGQGTVGGDTSELATAGIASTGDFDEVSQDGMVQAHWVDGRRAGRERRRRGRLWRRLLAVVGLLGLLAAGLIGAQTFLSSRYWVGFDGDQVAIFQGVPGDVAGVRLSRLAERTDIRRAQVPAAWQTRLDDGVTRSGLEDARRYARCTPVLSTGLDQCLTTGVVATTTTVSTTTQPPPRTTGR
jgi:serine/threonine protein phosphatase PrpC